MGRVLKILAPPLARTDFSATRTRPILENSIFLLTRPLDTREVNTRKPKGNFRVLKRAQSSQNSPDLYKKHNLFWTPWLTILKIFMFEK